MREGMKRGDLAFFSHSRCPAPGIAGIVKIVKEAYPDHTAFDPKDKHFDPDSDRNKPRWYMVDIQLKQKLRRLISLAELRNHSNGALQGLVLLRRGNRLSITPVTETEWQFIAALE